MHGARRPRRRERHRRARRRGRGLPARGRRPHVRAGRPRRAAVHRDRPGRPARHRVHAHPARPGPAARRGHPPRRRGLPAPRPHHGPGRHLAHPAAAARAGRVAGLRRRDPHRRACDRARRRPVRRGPVRPVHLPAVAHRDDRRLPAPPRRRPGAGRARRRSSPRSAATAWRVTELQPYLGAFGKLVALREGDLAYTAADAQPGRRRPRGARHRVHRPRPERRAPTASSSTSAWPTSCTPRSSPCRRGTHEHPDRPDHRRHDLRVVRQPRRAQAQQARRRHRHGQLRHREGARHLPGRARPGRAGRGGGGGGLHGRAAPAGRSGEPRPRTTPTRPLRNRLLVVAALAVPVVVLSMVPALQFPYWQWIALALAAPGRRLGRVAVPPGGRRRTCATARPRWTRWSRSAPWPRWAGRCTRCCSARRASRA